MKVQVIRFSTHQSAKVFALLMALASLLFMLPFLLIGLFSSGTAGQMGGFSLMFLIMPVFQGIFGYLLMRLGMWLYNKLVPRVGGIEFELEQREP